MTDRPTAEQVAAAEQIAQIATDDLDAMRTRWPDPASDQVAELEEIEGDRDQAREEADRLALSYAEGIEAGLADTGADGGHLVAAGHAAARAATSGADPVAAWRAHVPPTLRTASDPAPPPPDTVLSRGPLREDGTLPPGGTLLTVGHVGLLAGPGSSGKSALSRQIALAAASHQPDGAGLHRLGLAVRGGPVLLWAGEDPWAGLSGMLTAAAGQWPNVRPGLDELAVISAEDAGPLWKSPDYDRDRPGPTRAWAALAADITALRPVLVIVDPGAEALTASMGDAHTVRNFITRLAALCGAHGGAALVVVHSTKNDRDSRDPTAGAVAGSHQWFDSARMVATLRPIPPDRKGQEDHPDPDGSLGLVRSESRRRTWATAGRSPDVATTSAR